MSTARLSRTARYVLAARAVLTDMGVVDDPLPVMLPPSWRSSTESRSAPAADADLEGLAALACVVRRQVTRSAGRGCREVAVIGAG